MKQKILRVGVAVVLLGVVLAAWLMRRSEPRSHGPLPHEAYVWQRAWTEPVRESVAAHATNFAEVVVLAAEVSWKDKQPQLVRVAVDYPSLVRTNCRVGLALRIGPYAGPFADGDAITHYLTELAVALIAEARTNGVAPSELQLDFDCAESKLDGFRVWLEAIQRKAAPVPVTITALPSWLNASAFKRLAASATNYVLQVHSLERPRDVNDAFTLCEPTAARQAVERAGRLGVPFRVALPTYGYWLAFDRGGRFAGLSAEGRAASWPDEVQVREVRADPVAMAALVQGWTTNRPAALRGVIWYRLPVTVDNLNWRWPTLGAIVASRSFREELRAESRRVEAGLVEINLVNHGDLDISSRLAVEVRWSRSGGARLVAGDGLQGFTLREDGTSTVQFQHETSVRRLRAGESQTIGWLRFDRDCEVEHEIKKL